MIEFPCECGHIIKMRAWEGISQKKLEEIMNLDPLPSNWRKLLKEAKQKGQGITIRQLQEILEKRIRPLEVQCIHCHKIKNIEKLIPPPATYVVKPYRHPDSLHGNIQMF